ncbi:hypothetical protein DB30_02632 [Enhygromyxa salina]|uniref:Uncharacterized protein n=1 Tax=Enhygromyxa salina TaxID=215803 RepID=A0A0C2CPS4_9BACT|nr:hypothetical protein DB30_02632 [Enhygromyxa salina]
MAQTRDSARVPARVVEAERQRGLVDPAEHRAELGFDGDAPLLVERVGDEVAVAPGRRQQLAAPTHVDRELGEGHAQRGRVLDEMVGVDNHVALGLARLLDDEQAQQRRTGDVEGPGRREDRLGPRACVPTRPHAHSLDRDRGAAMHDLNRLAHALGHDRRAQRVVAIDEGLDRGDEARTGGLVVDPKQGRDQVRVVVWIHQVMEQDPLLGRDEGIDVLDLRRAARDRRDDRVELLVAQVDERDHARGQPLAAGCDRVGRGDVDGCPATVETLGELRERRRTKHRAHADRQAPLAQLGHEHGDQQRVTTKREERVLGADDPGLELEHLGPHLRERPLELGPWGDVAARDEGLAARHRQGLAIELAVGRDRQLDEGHERAGDHVLGQAPAEFELELGPAVGQGQPGIQDHVGHELLVARLIFAQHHRARVDLRLLAEPTLDLAELDAEAAELDLVVDAPEVVKRPVGREPGEVPGPIHPRAGLARQGVGDEALAALLGRVEVAPGQAVTGDVELTDAPDRHDRAVLVEHVELDVLDRSPDRHGRERRIVGHGPVADVDGGLGRPVEVVERGRRQALVVANTQLGAQGLAAAKHLTDAATARPAGLVEHGPEHRGHEVQRRDPVALDHLGEVGRILVALGLRDDEPSAVEQRPKELPDRHVEAEGRLLEDDIILAEAVLVLHPVDAVVGRAMLDHHALGPARRTRGVDDIGELARVEAYLGGGDVGLADRREPDSGRVRDPTVVEQGQAGRGPGQGRDVELRPGQDHGDPRALDDLGHAARRVPGIDRHVGSAGLERGVDRRDHHR